MHPNTTLNESCKFGNLYSTGKSDRADQLGGTTINNFAIFFFTKSYFSIVIFNILKDENDSSGDMVTINIADMDVYDNFLHLVK